MLPPAPRFVVVKAVGEDTNGAGEKLLTVEFTFRQALPVPKPKAGEPAPEPKLVLVPYKDVIPLNRLEVVTVEGKTIPEKEWNKLIGQVVLLSADDGPLDPAYVKLLAKDTIILTTRAAKKK